jgi:NAD(P)-dependent dehydrogenase (short-subunit alcohol dehydrogenase family)
VNSKRELEGKVCVITGGGQGIGAVTAKRFVAEGARIAILDLNPETAEKTAAELCSEGADARAYEVDVTKEDVVADAARAVAADFGGVDVLINNAGICFIGPSLTFPLDLWETSMNVMVTGVFLCSREFGKVLRDTGGGTIVNLSSINGLTSFPMRLAYSTAKAAVASMSRLLATEWAPYNIRVNAVAPGNTKAPMFETLVEEGIVDAEAYMAHMPLRRFAEPEEIAESILYLASDRSSYVTGEVLVIDGGWTAFGWIPWSDDPEAPDLSDSMR